MEAMEKIQRSEPGRDKATAISVTVHEASLIANMVYAASLNMQLDDHQIKMAHNFMVKLQRAALTITTGR